MKERNIAEKYRKRRGTAAKRENGNGGPLPSLPLPARAAIPVDVVDGCTRECTVQGPSRRTAEPTRALILSCVSRAFCPFLRDWMLVLSRAPDWPPGTRQWGACISFLSCPLPERRFQDGGARVGGCLLGPSAFCRGCWLLCSSAAELACCTRHCSLVVVRDVAHLEVCLFFPEFS